MQEDRPLNRQMLEKAFEMVGKRLADKKVLGEIAVYGGTAVMLQLEYREQTADVDCVVVEGHGAVMDAVRSVGRELNIGDSWLNENVSVYTSTKQTSQDLLPYGAYPKSSRPWLNVTMAKPEYLLAMKVEALRRSTVRDLSDVKMLASRLGLKSSEEIFRAHSLYFGPEHINLTIKQAVAGVAAALAEEPEADVGFTP
jgi:predicted nucleotidyltransferase